MLNPVTKVFLVRGKLVPFVTAFCFFLFQIMWHFWSLHTPVLTTYPIISTTHIPFLSCLWPFLSAFNCNCISKAFEVTRYREEVILKITRYSKKRTLKDQNKQGLGVRKLHFYCTATMNWKRLPLQIFDVLCGKKFLKCDLKIHWSVWSFRMRRWNVLLTPF
jgi:hypothetical protein